MQSIVRCVVALVLCLALAGVVQAAEPIRIGVFVSATGPGAYFGDPEAKTFKLEVDRVNREGGLLGRKLELTLYDDTSDPKQAVSFARKLLEQHKVDVLLGGSLTGTTMAVVPIVQDAEVPYISLAGATTIVQPVKKWVFKTPHTDTMAVEKVFIDMQKRKISKIALIGGSVGFDESCRKQGHILAPKYGMTILEDETWAPTDTDMTPQLTKIRSHADLQAVLNCGTQAPAVISVRNYQRLGMTKTPLYFSHGVASETFVQGAGAAAEGARLPAAALVVAEQLPAKDPQRKIGLDYRKAYEAAYHSPISTFGGHAKDAMVLYVAAVKQAGSTDKAKVRNALENLKNVIGVDGVFNTSPSDHMGLDTSAFHMIEIRKGKWKLLY
ncbi:MAG: ABC transporter substrate-binding protein [Terriglobales bacterium]